MDKKQFFEMIADLPDHAVLTIVVPKDAIVQVNDQDEYELSIVEVRKETFEGANELYSIVCA